MLSVNIMCGEKPILYFLHLSENVCWGSALCDVTSHWYPSQVNESNPSQMSFPNMWKAQQFMIVPSTFQMIYFLLKSSVSILLWFENGPFVGFSRLRLLLPHWCLCKCLLCTYTVCLPLFDAIKGAETWWFVTVPRMRFGPAGVRLRTLCC